MLVIGPLPRTNISGAIAGEKGISRQESGAYQTHATQRFGFGFRMCFVQPDYRTLADLSFVTRQASSNAIPYRSQHRRRIVNVNCSCIAVVERLRVANVNCLPARRTDSHRPERYFRRYTTVVSVSAGSGVGSP
jgi:hypothetical protein